MDLSLSYILNELGEEREQYFNAIAPPIVQTSNFAFKKVDELGKAFRDEMAGYLYSRGLNPTVDILRKKLAALDRAEDCLVFNSGAAAIYASVMANIKTGDHIVSVSKPYSWAQHLFNKILPRFGVTTTYIDGTQTEHFEQAITPSTSLIYLESPNSWEFALQDLKAVAGLARARGIITICDNSYCTPLYQRPVEMGIDISLQSATKYIGGHSDVVAGVISGSADMMRKIFENEYMTAGSGIQPFNAWLLIRGLRTLPLRLEKVSRNTEQVVEFLVNHPLIERVIHPFHPSFPQYELAKRQMEGACGLVSFVVRSNDREALVRFAESLRHILMAVSWGGYESLIIPGFAATPPEDFDPGNAGHRTFRLYIGLEEPDYIIADLEQGLMKIP